MLPDAAWFVALGALGLSLAGYFACSVGSWLQAAGRTQDSLGGRTAASAAADGHPEGWKGRDSLHVDHRSARSALFAGLSVAIGIVLQCTAVVSGDRFFDGPVDTPFAWSVLFAEQLFNTTLRGMPASSLPTFATIQPDVVPGRLLAVGVDVFYVAGVLAMGMRILASTFRMRELFQGSVRDLADYLENFDVSKGDRLTIHRVAVLRPLYREMVISLSKDEFFETVKG